MKRGGHVAGRRCSRYLCDSVQIHPTLKRRMSKKKKRKRGWILWAHKSFSSTAKNPPAVGQKPRHERVNHEGRNSAGLFLHVKTEKGEFSRHPFPPLQQWQPSALCLSPQRGRASVRCSGSPTRRDPPILAYPLQNERVPPTKPACRSKTPSQTRHLEWRQSKCSAFDNTDISLLCHRHQQTQSAR